SVQYAPRDGPGQAMRVHGPCRIRRGYEGHGGRPPSRAELRLWRGSVAAGRLGRGRDRRGPGLAVEGAAPDDGVEAARPLDEGDPTPVEREHRRARMTALSDLGPETGRRAEATAFGVDLDWGDMEVEPARGGLPEIRQGGPAVGPAVEGRAALVGVLGGGG